MRAPSRLVTKSDSPAGEIVWRDGHGHAVAGENANTKLPHFAGGGGEQPVPVVEVDSERGAWKHLADDAFEFYCFFLHGVASRIKEHTRRRGIRVSASVSRVAAPPCCGLAARPWISFVGPRLASRGGDVGAARAECRISASGA